MTLSFSDLTPATVTLDGLLNDLPAYLPDYRWNGWACPYFKASDIRAARAQFDKWGSEFSPDEDMRYRWDDVTDLPSFVSTYEDDPAEYEEVATLTIDGVECVTIGWAAWVWSVQDDEDE